MAELQDRVLGRWMGDGHQHHLLQTPPGFASWPLPDSLITHGGLAQAGWHVPTVTCPNSFLHQMFRYRKPPERWGCCIGDTARDSWEDMDVLPRVHIAPSSCSPAAVVSWLMSVLLNQNVNIVLLAQQD